MIEDSVREGHLIKTAPDAEKAQKSMALAKNRIEKAEEENGAGFYDDALVSAYTAMFHAARALLFRDGYKERNHYVVYEYLRERYRERIEMRYINELNVLRTMRHKVIYGDDEVNVKEIGEVESESAIRIAKGFLESVETLLR